MQRPPPNWPVPLCNLQRPFAPSTVPFLSAHYIMSQRASAIRQWEHIKRLQSFLEGAPIPINEAFFFTPANCDISNWYEHVAEGRPCGCYHSAFLCLKYGSLGLRGSLWPWPYEDSWWVSMYRVRKDLTPLKRDALTGQKELHTFHGDDERLLTLLAGVYDKVSLHYANGPRLIITDCRLSGSWSTTNLRESFRRLGSRGRAWNYITVTLQLHEVGSCLM